MVDGVCFVVTTQFLFCSMLFSLYLLFMLFLTTSLVLAARSSDPSQYNNPVDRFRLFCEIITLIWVLVDLVLEIYEVGRVMSVYIITTISVIYTLYLFIDADIRVSSNIHNIFIPHILMTMKVVVRIMVIE